MRAAPGIAGSRRPEVAGCFLCLAGEEDLFVRLDNTGGPVDVWEVSGVVPEEVIDAGSGFCYVARTIAPMRSRW